MADSASVEVLAPVEGRFAEVITPEALDFLAGLHRRFNATRKELLAARLERQKRFDAGEKPDFLPETKHIRDDPSWKVAPITTADLQDRRVEITGPTNRRMVINALNCGAKVFMADFEDANTPTWVNMVDGQVNMIDATNHTISLTTPEGREYKLNDTIATLLVRARGWHLDERHVRVDGEPISGSLFDFGLYFFHNAKNLIARGSGPYYYLPKMESHLEARLWNEVFTHSEETLGVPHGSIKATVLIETILGAFEIEEILYELRDHSAGCNAGRWDYIFSVMKKFRGWDMLLPDRGQITMTVPFMRSYTELLVKTCHKRGAFAIGGMAAFIPSRRDADVNAIAMSRVKEDKMREANDGFDGTWVAHPDLVSVAMEVFDSFLGVHPNQMGKQRPEVNVNASDLINFAATGGTMTEAGLRANVSVGIQYLEAWLNGTGAVAIFNLMEDAATAEISRSQIWQWLHHGAKLEDGRPVTIELVKQITDEELAKLPAGEPGRKFTEAREVFETVATDDVFVDFLTWPAYELID